MKYDADFRSLRFSEKPKQSRMTCDYCVIKVLLKTGGHLVRFGAMSLDGFMLASTENERTRCPRQGHRILQSLRPDSLTVDLRIA